MTEPNYCTPSHSIEYKLKDAASNEQRTCLVTTDAHGMTVAIGGQMIVLDVANGDVRVFVCEDGEELDDPVATIQMEYTPLREAIYRVNSVHGKGDITSITIESGDPGGDCTGTAVQRIRTTRTGGHSREYRFSVERGTLRFLGHGRKLRNK